MTENEAIKRHIDECKHRIENIRTFMGNNKDANVETCTENIRIFETAIQALEEIQQYRAIGTVEECRAAVERMKPKKPIIINQGRLTDFKCPCCGVERIVGRKAREEHCGDCGQKLKWGEEE